MEDNNKRLWQGVVLQALLDAGNLSKSINPSWSTPSRNFMHKRVADEAKKWFTDNCQDFQDVCHLANLDPRLIRKFAMKVARGDAASKKSLIEWRDWFKRPKFTFNTEKRKNESKN